MIDKSCFNKIANIYNISSEKAAELFIENTRDTIWRDRVQLGLDFGIKAKSIDSLLAAKGIFNKRKKQATKKAVHSNLIRFSLSKENNIKINYNASHIASFFVYQKDKKVKRRNNRLESTRCGFAH